MIKQLALILGLYATTMFGQVNKDDYFTKRPEYYQTFFSESITENLISYNYLELFQDENYISSSLFQKVFGGSGLYGNVSASQSREEGWSAEYGLGGVQELFSSDIFYGETYYMPFWFNKEGRIKGQKILGAYLEFYPFENASIYGYVDVNVDKKISFSSAYLTLEMDF